MFGLFKKTKKQENKKTTPKQNQKHEPELSSNEVLNSIAKMQKELDRLKMAISAQSNFSQSESTDHILKSALEEVRTRASSAEKSGNEKVIEGVFNGASMVGGDGMEYDVPANYASKSKLVEGDILKLTINNLGAFVYKQIKPIERLRQIGVLEQDPFNLQFFASLNGKKWKLLTASVTYFKGEPGDEVVFLTPTESGSRWAAVENIVKK
ncbi:MAG: hypothetical protein V1928_02365 [Parcubacteria group bacterium]